jgi:hypothetical protein
MVNSKRKRYYGYNYIHSRGELREPSVFGESLWRQRPRCRICGSSLEKTISICMVSIQLSVLSGNNHQVTVYFKQNRLLHHQVGDRR